MKSTKKTIISIFAITLLIVLALNFYNIAVFIDQIYTPVSLTQRKVTYGDKKWSEERKVFIKNLNYDSSIKLKGFNVYLEKGFWFDPWNINKSVFNKNTNYPYQISFTAVDTLIAEPYAIFKIVNIQKFDSIDNEFLKDACVYLKKPKLKDTLILKIIKLDQKRDSIGYVKVWE